MKKLNQGISGRQEMMELAATFSGAINHINHFAVQFMEDSVLIGKNQIPLGQTCVDMMAVDNELLRDIEAKAKDLQMFTNEKIFNPGFPKDVALVIELKLCLNALAKQILQLPLYKYLGIEVFSGQGLLAGRC